MKVLIIDDQQEKIHLIRDSLERLLTKVEILASPNYWDAVYQLDQAEDTFDFIVCDMQFPIKSTDRIDREAGIKMLHVITKMKLKAKIVIATSSATVNKLLEDRGYGHIPAIVASPMYDLDSQFVKYITDYI